ncbi:MAG: hypothetical protein CMH46_10015 [Muricauda sp.]|nr:hypothetical protein [Allomuricauda sp.]
MILGLLERKFVRNYCIKNLKYLLFDFCFDENAFYFMGNRTFTGFILRKRATKTAKSQHFSELNALFLRTKI